jgi:dCTP diphosphatase|tara:strand:+ start:181 stop:549 length:369 start_codon:yes stop_codon:yes gene_type:complete
MSLDEADSSLNDALKRINNFASEREWGQFHTPKNIASSISIEAAELLECFQWENPSISEVLGNEVLLNSVEEEVADVLIYALRMCSILSMDVIETVNKKLVKNGQKYPIEKSRGSSLKSKKL